MLFLYSFLKIWAVAAGVVLGLMTLVWLFSLLLRDSSIVDVFWGLGFVLVTWIAFLLTPTGYAGRKVLLVLLVTIWGLRLSLHILLRNWGRGEDFRYAQWRRAAGPSWWWRSYLRVFLLQGFFLWLISAPLLAAQASPLSQLLTPWDALAILIWAVGFFFEAVGDWQLSRFRADPAKKGRLLTTGLWRYTRHPNYFGDAVVWWAYYLVAVVAGGAWTLFSPILMTFLLVRVSGAAMLERSLRQTKPGYAEYARRTSAFVPWFPRGSQ
jgi:steroid 5-alpha reductase family enzyme